MWNNWRRCSVTLTVTFYNTFWIIFFILFMYDIGHRPQKWYWLISIPSAFTVPVRIASAKGLICSRLSEMTYRHFYSFQSYENITDHFANIGWGVYIEYRYLSRGRELMWRILWSRVTFPRDNSPVLPPCYYTVSPTQQWCPPHFLFYLIFFLLLDKHITII